MICNSLIADLSVSHRNQKVGAGSQAPMWSPGTLFQQPAWCLQESRGLEWAKYELAIFYGCIRDLCLTARSLVANMLGHGPTQSQHIAGCRAVLSFARTINFLRGKLNSKYCYRVRFRSHCPDAQEGLAFDESALLSEVFR